MNAKILEYFTTNRSQDGMQFSLMASHAPRTYRKLCVKILHLALLLLFVTPVEADDIIVVGSKRLPTENITRSEVTNIYLGKGKNDHKLTPYDRDNKFLREQFYREVTGLSLSSVRAYWAKQVFTGRGHPPAILKQSEIETTFKENPTAITYAPNKQRPDNSKILFSSDRKEDMDE